MSDRLEEIRAKNAMRGRVDHDDTDWLIAEVERLRVEHIHPAGRWKKGNGGWMQFVFDEPVTLTSGEACLHTPPLDGAQCD